MKIFIDCDEVLLSFDELMKRELNDLSTDYNLELVDERSEFCLSSVKEYELNKKQVMELVDKIFIENKIMSQKLCHELEETKEELSKLLDDDRCHILTKIPEFARPGRIACLNQHFNLDLSHKMHSVYGAETKSDKILSLIKEESFTEEKVYLIDDNTDNLLPWLRAGGRAILINRSYNKKEAIELKKDYGDRFEAIEPKDLTIKLKDLLK